MITNEKGQSVNDVAMLMETKCQLKIKMSTCYIFIWLVQIILTVECFLDQIPEHLFVSLSMYFGFIPFFLPIDRFDDMMFTISVRNSCAQHRPICMTTNRWHKSVNTLDGYASCAFYTNRRREKKETPHTQTFEWYSNRLNVYYLVFYWNVLSFSCSLNMLKHCAMVSHMFILASEHSLCKRINEPPFFHSTV